MLSIVMIEYLVDPSIKELTKYASSVVRKNTVGEYELIIICHTPENRLSIAQAYNMGFAKAKGDIFCVLHNDVIVPPGWNMKLAEVARYGDIAFPMVDESGSDCSDRGVPKTAKWQTTGCCFVLSRDLWEKLGGYDEGYTGFHWEDTDLFMRATRHCRAALVRCNVTVNHLRGATRTFVLDEEQGYFRENFNRYKEKWKDNLVIPLLSETPQEG